MQGIVDRIEGDFAIVELEESVFTEISVDELPRIPQEGDLIDLDSKQIIQSDFNKDDLTTICQYFK